MVDIQIFLEEMDIMLRFFEKQKKEAEDFLKLEDLASRIKGLQVEKKKRKTKLAIDSFI
jgi:hypothetical protein